MKVELSKTGVFTFLQAEKFWSITVAGKMDQKTFISNSSGRLNLM